MNYSTFINIEPQYHQVCSNDIASIQWINYHQIDRDATHIFTDYRFVAFRYFQLLAMFCNETQKTVDDALQVFSQTQLISS